VILFGHLARQRTTATAKCATTRNLPSSVIAIRCASSRTGWVQTVLFSLPPQLTIRIARSVPQITVNGSGDSGGLGTLIAEREISSGSMLSKGTGRPKNLGRASATRASYHHSSRIASVLLSEERSS
jgi:hypothetical protein